jgi:alpha-1,3-rhamnosyl/mannosyltransferase
MKILVDAIPMSGLLTGIARYLRNLYGTMGLMDQVDLSYFKGGTVENVMPALADPLQRQRYAKVVRGLPDPVVFGLRAARWLKYENALNQAFRTKRDADRFDVYHETELTPAKFTKIPTLYSIYDLSLRHYRETHPRERVWFFEYFIKTRLQYAGHILTISEFVRQEIIEEFNLCPSMVTSVPLAPDPLFVPCRADLVEKIRIKYHLPQSYLLFVSSLEPRKNIDLLIEALEIATTDIPLVLVGWQGWGEKKWLEKIKGTEFKGRIHIIGHLPDDDLKAVYNGALSLVYPSLYEGFGLPIVEAMACGCPVICSNAASMPEVAGDAAILIDPHRSDELAHAIDTLVHDTDLRNSLVVKGFKQASTFTWDDAARKTLDVFRKMI